MNDATSWKPEILTSSTPQGRRRIAQLSRKQDTRVVDIEDKLIKELAVIEYPELYFSGKLSNAIDLLRTKRTKEGIPSVWAWYPWKKMLVSILPENEYTRIRSSRNRFLISDAEQARFRSLPIGIAGLSVGYSIALAIVMEGGGKYLKLADNDTLDLSNLNRLPYSIEEIGEAKTTIVARRLYEIDPYLEITVYPKGLQIMNVSQFVSGLKVVVDEVDSLQIKQLLRKEAKKKRLPVIMATDNEGTGLIDVERYDLNPKTIPFLGRLPSLSAKQLSKLSKMEAGRLIAQYVGDEYTTDRMMSSLKSIGTELVSWPQIGGTALINGGAVAYAIRLLIANKRLPQTGRYPISLPIIFDSKD